MLTRVDVLSENPFYLEIRNARPTDSIIVEKIDGLTPPPVDLFMGEYARDGGYYGGRRVPSRTVIFTLKLNPNYRVEESTSGLREMLYRAFMDPQIDGDALVIVLHDDEKPDRYLSGYTEKMDPEIFSETKGFPITMVCPNPYLLNTTDTVITADGPSAPFPYVGSAETGFEVTATITSATSILHLNLNAGKLITLEYAFQIGDQIIVNTQRGQRRVRVVRATVPTDILYAKTSVGWPELHKTANVLAAYGADDNTVVADIDEIRFRTKWWGV